MDPISNIFQWVWQFLVDFWPVRIIEAGQQGVRLRHNGTADLLTPGLWLHWPRLWRIVEVDAQYQNVDAGLQSLTTSDGKEVTISLNLGYEIRDARTMWVSFQNFDVTLVNIARGVAANIVTTTTWESLLGDPKGVEKAILQELRKDLSGSGVKLQSVVMDQISRVKTLRLLQTQGF